MEVNIPKAGQIEDASGLKAYAVSLGFQSVGVCAAEPSPHIAAYEAWLGKGYHGTMEYLLRHCSIKKSPKNVLFDAQSIVAVALNYNQQNEPKPGQPRVARYALGRDYHKVIRGKLRKLAAWIEREHPGSQSRACVDSAPILERDYAQLAGLGWFGKNTCLIDSQKGSWFFIGLLLTTVSFAEDEPAVGGCGTCRKCVDACPTGAIVQEEGLWQVDARRCISYLTIEHRGEIDEELAHKLGGWTFGCDVCQEVCPFNEPRASQPARAPRTTERDFLERRELPSLQELAVIQPDAWDRLTSGSAIRRTGIEGIRRNARLNLSD